LYFHFTFHNHDWNWSFSPVDFNPKFNISLIILNSKIYNETGDYEEAIAVESSGKSFKNHN
jgi:hypothetical protein